MTLEYRNRKGDVYYAYQGLTKTGKPKYFASKRESSDKGERLKTMPSDYEFAENPSDGGVTLRRIKPSNILPQERELVSKLVLKLTQYKSQHTVIDGDSIVVFTPSGPQGLGSFYTATLRFVLLDSDKRIFYPERFCFRGSIDDWINIGEPASLNELARKFIPYLGKEAFFDLC